MMSLIRSLIKRCITTKAMSDAGNFPIVQMSYHEKAADAELFSPYGLWASPPVGSLGIVFNTSAQEENRVAMINGPLNRFKNLNEGEALVGNIKTKAHILFKENGDIEIFAPAGKIKLSDGTILAEALVKFTELKTYIDAHVHTDPQGGNTGTPTTTLPTNAATTIVNGA